mgnify:FL=1
MSDCESSLLSPTRIVPSMTPPISLTITTTRSWPFVISASHGSACTRENGILHQYRPFLIQWVSFGLLIKTVILLMLHSTPFALWTSPQWNRICEWSVINLSTTNKRMISLSLTCQRNTTCNLYCFQTTLKYHLPTHSLCFLDTIIQPNQHHSPEYPKPSCIDIIIISPICNWNPIMAQSSSSYQHSLLVPVPYDQQPTHSNTLPFTTIEAHTYSFYSCLSLQSMVPITLAVIQPIRWIHGTHNVQDMLHWRWWDQNQLSFHRRKRIPRW